MLSTTGLMSKVRESVDGDVVISLAVSPSEVDLSFLQRMFNVCLMMRTGGYSRRTLAGRE